MRTRSLLFAAFFVFTAFAAAAVAEVPVVVIKAANGVEAGFYTYADEAAYSAAGLPADSHIKLTSTEVESLRSGETLLVSERMPTMGEISTAWGIRFTKATPQKLYGLIQDYDNYQTNFPDMLETVAFNDTEGEPRIVYLKKDASKDVSMTLFYDSVKNKHKEWRLATEDDLKHFPQDSHSDIKKWMKRNNFQFNRGGWYFVGSDHEALGEHNTVIVRKIAVKLSGMLNMIKGPEKLKEEAEEEMPQSIGRLVELGE